MTKFWHIPELVWRAWDPLYWRQALLLTTLPWPRSFLVLMGLERDLVEKIDVWSSIYLRMEIKYETEMLLINHVGGDKYTYLERKISLLFVKELLHSLDESLGSGLARSFECWIWRNFLMHEVKAALFSWEVILRDACLLNRDQENRVAPPSFLEPLIPKIVPLLFDVIDASPIILRWAMPPLLPETLSEPGGDECLTGDALDILRVIRQEMTLKSLQVIANHLSKEQQLEFVQWSIEQATKTYNILPRSLKSEKILKTESLCEELVSLLNISAEDIIYQSENLLARLYSL